MSNSSIIWDGSPTEPRVPDPEDFWMPILIVIVGNLLFGVWCQLGYEPYITDFFPFFLDMSVFLDRKCYDGVPFPEFFFLGFGEKW